MKKLLILTAAAVALSIASPDAQARGGGHGGGHTYSGGNSHTGSSGTGDHYVHGYTKKDGTYVEGYHATNPNGTKNDNYSTKGNSNPYTGKEGTKPRDGE